MYEYNTMFVTVSEISNWKSIYNCRTAKQEFRSHMLFHPYFWINYYAQVLDL